MVGYAQLEHNVWDPGKRQSRAQVIHGFGREDRLDREALARLVRSIARFLDPGGRSPPRRRRGCASSTRCRWAAPGCSTSSGAGSASARRFAGWRRGGG